MEWETFSEDQLDELITSAEAGIARLRAIEMAAIAEKRTRGTHLADGYRSIVDWVAARADVSHRTARRLTWTASRLQDAPRVGDWLADGSISFDRAEQVSRLPREHRDNHHRFDISQLRRKVAHYRKLSPTRERRISTNGFLNFQPTVDETMDHIWGELPGIDSRTVRKAIDQRADEILASSLGLGVAERRALALVAICQDSLYTEHEDPESPATQITVTVDARTAAKTNGQTGVWVLEGRRIGIEALEAVACNAIVEVIGVTKQGEPINLGRRTRTVSPALRRFVLDRDKGCTVEGCSSTYRLEAHHTTPWSEGGSTNAENLVTLCWFHHHIAIHRHGMRIQRIGASCIRLVRSTVQRAPPHQSVAFS